MRKALAVILALSAVFALSSCGKARPQTARISFDSNPTTGYTWNAFQSGDLFDIASEYTPESSDQELVGSGGTHTFTLTPLKAGNCKVSFVYQRPWEAMELGDTYTYDITVTERLQIKVNGGTADVSGDANILPIVPEFVIK